MREDSTIIIKTDIKIIPDLKQRQPISFFLKYSAAD
jgi:hypothetical protein